MAIVCLNVPLKVSEHSFSEVSISASSNYYVNLGSISRFSGYVPICVSFDLSGMSSFDTLVSGALQQNDSYIWARIFNNSTSASTGSITAFVYWARIQS